MTSHPAGSPVERYNESFSSDLSMVRQHLAGLQQETDRLEGRVEALDQKIDRSHDQIIGLLTQLVGHLPDAG
ncbi:hypothetical protein [Streptomyces sp. NPDC060010]|uniref:hypothetical protein n=1 Tax=Streptomyces sp. NPDC060010 TaxID=3347036 RepID=UPI0036B822A9